MCTLPVSKFPSNVVQLQGLMTIENVLGGVMKAQKEAGEDTDPNIMSIDLKLRHGRGKQCP
jgi:hypothetical protein